MAPLPAANAAGEPSRTMTTETRIHRKVERRTNADSFAEKFAMSMVVVGSQGRFLRIREVLVRHRGNETSRILDIRPLAGLPASYLQQAPGTSEELLCCAYPDASSTRLPFD